MATMDVSGDLRALIHSHALCKHSLTFLFHNVKVESVGLLLVWAGCSVHNIESGFQAPGSAIGGRFL